MLKQTRGRQIAAFELAVVERPLRNLDNSTAQSVVMNNFIRKELFQTLAAHDARALIAHPEMSSFDELIPKKQREGSGERRQFCCLDDGMAEWTLISFGNARSKDSNKKECWEVLSENALALGGFTQPEPFLQLFKPLERP